MWFAWDFCKVLLKQGFGLGCNPSEVYNLQGIIQGCSVRQMCFVWHYPTKVVRMECASITGNSHVFKVLCTLEDLLLVLEVPLGLRLLSKLFGIKCQSFFPHYPAWLQTLICGVHDLGVLISDVDAD
jgi:hypothetical protein